MGTELAHGTITRPPRLLVVEKNFSAIEPFIRTFGDRRLNMDFDVSSSHRGAVGMLLASSYQLIICGAHLAEMEDFFLLKRIQSLEPFVPVVVTASTAEKESACRALMKGAFDLIPSPPDPEQTVRTIRLALWHGRLKNLIARKEAALEQYHQHLAEYPDDREALDESFKKTISAFESMISSVAQTIQRLDESLVCFSDFASRVESQTRKRALERLDSLSTPPRGGNVICAAVLRTTFPA